MDDLSRGPREVLCIIDELYRDKVHPIVIKEIANLSDLGEDRILAALARLHDLRCIKRDTTASYMPTDLGVKLAADIRADEEA